MLAGSLAGVGLLLGLWGIRWGLPSAERTRRVLPPGLDTPAFHQRLTDTWVEMHKRLGQNLMINPASSWNFSGVQRLPAGWKEPPAIMVDPVRSFYLRSAHDDEQTFLIILSRMKPLKLDLHPHMFIYGSAHIYSLGASLAAGAATGLVKLHRSLAPYMAEPARMAAMYLPGRLLSVLAYVGCGLLLLLIGRRHIDTGTGWLAGLMFLCSPAAVVQAHVLKHSTFWTFFALLAFERSAEVVKEGRLRDYALAGVAVGLVLGTSLGGWPVALAVALAAVLRVRAGNKPLAEVKGVCLAAGAAVGVFFLTNPYWVLDWPEASAELAVIRQANSGFNLSQPLVFVSHALRYAVTAPVLALMALGAFLAARQGSRKKALLLCLGFLCLGLASTATFQKSVEGARSMRYFLVWMAFGLLLAGRAVFAPGKWRTLRLALGALAALNLFFEGLTYSYNFHVAATTASNHCRAGEWIEANIPPGATVGALRLPAPSNIPYFRFDRYDLVLIEHTLFKGLPPEKLPQFMLVTIPDYDDRPDMGPNLSRYDRLAVFDRPVLFPWIRIQPSATTANPVIEVYRLRS